MGDGKGGIVALGERECTLQRRSQKIVELAPSPNLKPALRKKIVDAAIVMAKAVKYRSLGTFEFLVDGGGLLLHRGQSAPAGRAHRHRGGLGRRSGEGAALLAGGASLAKAGLEGAAPRGHAIQLRVNMETMTEDGSAKPGGGTLTVFEPPSGPGVRVDTYGYAGYRTNPNFDSLLAKVIVHSPSPIFADALARAERALAALPAGRRAQQHRLPARPAGRHGDFRADKVHTRFVDEHAEEADRRGGQAAGRPLFPGRRSAADRRAGRPARGSMPSIRWRCWRSARRRAQADLPRRTERRAGGHGGGARADAGHDRQPRR